LCIERHWPFNTQTMHIMEFNFWPTYVCTTSLLCFPPKPYRYTPWRDSNPRRMRCHFCLFYRHSIIDKSGSR
jgi:hypothetical protein